MRARGSKEQRAGGRSRPGRGFNWARSGHCERTGAAAPARRDSTITPLVSELGPRARMDDLLTAAQ